MSETLFPGYEPEVRPLLPSEEPGLSADRKRTLRQAEEVQAGIHPLTKGPLHPLASKHRDAASPKADPFTCGSCWFRQLVKHHDYRYPKCFHGAENPTDTAAGRLPWVTGSAATDVRAWWPACPNYTPSDHMSGDAMRHIPTEKASE